MDYDELGETEGTMDAFKKDNKKSMFSSNEEFNLKMNGNVVTI